MDRILVLDFGGQYDLLIARRVREHHVFAEIKPYGKISAEEVKRGGYRGIIFTGGPASVYQENAPRCDPEICRAERCRRRKAPVNTEAPRSASGKALFSTGSRRRSPAG